MAGNFLEQIRRAQEAAKTTPETETPKPVDEMTDANLGAERSRLRAPSRRRRFVCTTCFRIPRLCNRSLT